MTDNIASLIEQLQAKLGELKTLLDQCVDPASAAALGFSYAKTFADAPNYYYESVARAVAMVQASHVSEDWSTLLLNAVSLTPSGRDIAEGGIVIEADSPIQQAVDAIDGLGFQLYPMVKAQH